MIERFIEDYAERAFQFAYHLCGNVEDAKELVQESFVRLIRGWDAYDRSQPLENWYLTILRNLYFDGLKRYERRHAVPLDASLGGDGETFADVIADADEEPLLARLERQELAQEVRRAIAGLSPEHRAVLTLGDLQGLGYEQLARALDCPLGTVRSRLSRARLALRKALLKKKEEVIDR